MNPNFVNKISGLLLYEVCVEVLAFHLIKINQYLSNDEGNSFLLEY